MIAKIVMKIFLLNIIKKTLLNHSKEFIIINQVKTCQKNVSICTHYLKHIKSTKYKNVLIVKNKEPLIIIQCL